MSRIVTSVVRWTVRVAAAPCPGPRLSRINSIWPSFCFNKMWFSTFWYFVILHILIFISRNWELAVCLGYNICTTGHVYQWWWVLPWRYLSLSILLTVKTSSLEHHTPPTWAAHSPNTHWASATFPSPSCGCGHDQVSLVSALLCCQCVYTGDLYYMIPRILRQDL